ncbi:hypothetical protein OsI_37713 [Oryza sativa Indica Group]|uniref:Uncharacterized protein n=1 Tax=Oryza sativa subsp. indica TaxID=39946 RepID=B8BNH7_ORYSI|nr:hypothetical protein OsI_37713 [Oryza sativa Indica Group]
MLGGGGRQQQLAALRKIKAITTESDCNKRCVEATPGAFKFLVSVVVQSHAAASTYTSAKSDDDLLDSVIDSRMSTSSPEEEALGVLYSLKPSEPTLCRILGKDNGGFLDTLASVLLLKAMTSAMPPERLGCRPRHRSIRSRTPLRCQWRAFLEEAGEPDDEASAAAAAAGEEQEDDATASISRQRLACEIWGRRPL